MSIRIDDERPVSEWITLVEWLIDNWDDVAWLMFALRYRGEDDAWQTMYLEELTQHHEWLSIKEPHLLYRNTLEVCFRSVTQMTIFELKFS